MEVLIAYDVSTESAAGQRRLRRVANLCVGHGQRVQKSVFECRLTEVQLERLTHRLLREIDLDEDSLRIYQLPQPRERYVRIYGRQPEFDLSGPLLV